MGIFWAVLATACVTQTLSNGELFRPVREWLGTRMAATPRTWLKHVYFLALCRYCLSHWVALLVILWAGAPWLALFPVIWLANHSLILYDILANVPVLMRVSAQRALLPR